MAPTYRILRDGTISTLQEVIPWGEWHKTEMKYTLPNGTALFLRSAADVSKTLRSVHFDREWFDEAAHMPGAAINTAMGRMRAAKDPRVLLTTNPHKGADMYDMFVANPGADTLIVTAPTSENPSVSRVMLEMLRRQYGPKLSAQELDGEWIDLAGGLWERSEIVVVPMPRDHRLLTVVVSVDPSVGGGDECGIVVVAKDADGHSWVLDDASGRYAVTEWPEVVVETAATWSKQTGTRAIIVAEKNQGGHLVERAIRSVDKLARYDHVTAKVSKTERAQPVAVAYRMGRVSHASEFARLVSQMVGWSPDKSGESPDRLDALVHGLTYLDIADSPAVWSEVENPATRDHTLHDVIHERRRGY
jgi:phage terminase large subunit-like protein